jgi:alpha-glucosidase (family GH31 glycosyl hydrolase)
MVWNDMNEPACFNQTEATISKNTLHNFIPDDEREDSHVVEHRAVHNVYGLFNSMATAKGLLSRTSGHERVFSLSRSFFAGS